MSPIATPATGSEPESTGRRSGAGLIDGGRCLGWRGRW